jgi:putative toxin-antitoxin system antitoxin component (TIGR02293 family)
MLPTVESYKNPYLLVKVANEGINASNLEELYVLTKHNKNFFAEILLISTKTIERYVKENKKFNPSESEKLMKLQEIYQWGIEVFGTAEEFNQWIEKPAYGLNHLIPKELMKTISGIKLVEDELVRIAYGELA